MKTEALEELCFVHETAYFSDLAKNAGEELQSIKASDREARVADFHHACSLPVASEPRVGTPEQRELRCKLLLEEVFEFIHASGCSVAFGHKQWRIISLDPNEYPPDLVAMTHDLADVQYVTSGTAVELGLPLAAAFAEVHAANMRKVGSDGNVVMVNGKVCKPEGWVPADVAKVLGQRKDER